MSHYSGNRTLRNLKRTICCQLCRSLMPLKVLLKTKKKLGNWSVSSAIWWRPWKRNWAGKKLPQKMPGSLYLDPRRGLGSVWAESLFRGCIFMRSKTGMYPFTVGKTIIHNYSILRPVSVPFWDGFPRIFIFPAGTKLVGHTQGRSWKQIQKNRHFVFPTKIERLPGKVLYHPWINPKFDDRFWDPAGCFLTRQFQGWVCELLPVVLTLRYTNLFRKDHDIFLVTRTIIGLVNGKLYRTPLILSSNMGVSCKFSHYITIINNSWRPVQSHSPAASQDPEVCQESIQRAESYLCQAASHPSKGPLNLKAAFKSCPACGGPWAIKNLQPIFRGIPDFFRSLLPNVFFLRFGHPKRSSARRGLAGWAFEQSFVVGRDGGQTEGRKQHGRTWPVVDRIDGPCRCESLRRLGPSSDWWPTAQSGDGTL